MDVAALVRAAPLGDARRNERALALVTALVQGQAAATDGAAGAAADRTPWAHAMGAWRFFNNEAIERTALYQPVRQALVALLPPDAVAFVVHDLSVLDYSHHAAKADRVRVGNAWGLGYELYTALVLDAHGRPLGPGYQSLLTQQGQLSSDQEAPFAVEDHYALVARGRAAVRALLPGRLRVHVYDREFDDLGTHRAHEAEGEHEVVRVKHLRRSVRWQGEDSTIEQVASALVLHHAAQVEHQGRCYELYVAATEVTLQGPSWRARHRGLRLEAGAPIQRRLVVAELRHPEQTVRWVLLTDLAVEAEAVVQVYVWRWRVERYFSLNKVGFRLEQWKQTHGEAIARRLAVVSLAAMVLYQLQASLHQPESALVVAWAARQGGWLGRRRDPLGPTVLMRGLFSIIHALALLEQHGADELHRRAEALAQRIGLPIPGTSRAARPKERRPPKVRRRTTAGNHDV